MMLPDDYLRAVADAAHEAGGLFVLDCIASGAMWVDMRATGVDVLVSAPAERLERLALLRLRDALGSRPRADRRHHQHQLRRRPQEVAAGDGGLRGGAHLYHTTMPTDALARTRDAMLETRARGFAKLRAEQEKIGATVRALLERNGYASVAAAGFKAPSRGRELYRRRRPAEQQDVPRPRPADGGGRAAPVRRGRRLQDLPHRPLRPREARQHRADRGPPRRGTAGDRAGTPKAPCRGEIPFLTSSAGHRGRCPPGPAWKRFAAPSPAAAAGRRPLPPGPARRLRRSPARRCRTAGRPRASAR